MFTSFALLKLEDWGKLSRGQRPFVWQHVVDPLLSRKLADVKAGLSLILLLGALWLGSFGPYMGIPMILAIVFLPGELVDFVVVARHRQAVSTFIQSHRKEIELAVLTAGPKIQRQR